MFLGERRLGVATFYCVVVLGRSFEFLDGSALTHSKECGGGSEWRLASVKTIKMDSLDPMTQARARSQARPSSVQIKGEGAGTKPKVKMIYLQIYRRMKHDSLLSSAYCYSVSAT